MAGSRVGRQTEPSAQELKFIFSRLDSLSDLEVLADMQETSFPRRTRAFVRRCRKEYTAARNVLRSQVATIPVPTDVRGNGAHVSDLLALLGGCSRRLAPLPAMFVPAEELYHDCLRAHSVNSNGSHLATPHSVEPTVNSEEAFFCHIRARYLRIPGWSSDAAIPWIGISCARGRACEDSPNARMHYECLRQHLCGSAAGELWDDWESLAVQYVQASFTLWNQVCADAQSLFQLIVAWAHSPDEIEFSLDDGFARTVYERLACSGFCDMYPCGPAEYSYTTPRVLLGKRPVPLLRYGHAVILNASAKTKDMLRMDRTAELTRERVVSPVTELHQHLISKYETSGEGAETLRLQDEVGKLSERLGEEFDTLLEQGAMPGHCLICSNGR